jgi:uncharacterized protein YbjT (DUF2867 family)
VKLTVFGASGGTGSQVVSQALDAGHDVVNLRRGLRVSRADVAHLALAVAGDPDTYRAAIFLAD